jgi:rRNA processing protein Gar1
VVDVAVVDFLVVVEGEVVSVAAEEVDMDLDSTQDRQMKFLVSPSTLKVFFYTLSSLTHFFFTTEMGKFVHAVEGEMLCASTNASKVPYFNAPIYLANKSSIGKVDEILGPINEVYFTVKMGEGLVAKSFNAGDKVFIAPDRLLPIERFLPKPAGAKGARASPDFFLSTFLFLLTVCFFCSREARSWKRRATRGWWCWLPWRERWPRRR